VPALDGDITHGVGPPTVRTRRASLMRRRWRAACARVRLRATRGWHRADRCCRHASGETLLQHARASRAASTASDDASMAARPRPDRRAVAHLNGDRRVELRDACVRGVGLRRRPPLRRVPPAVPHRPGDVHPEIPGPVPFIGSRHESRVRTRRLDRGQRGHLREHAASDARPAAGSIPRARRARALGRDAARAP
jgi:hypothetical protein